MGPTRPVCGDGRPDRAADRDFRNGLPDRRRAQAGRHPHQPGLDNPGQRRQRTRQNRSARGQSRRRQHRPDTGVRAGRGDGGRRSRLLLQSRLLVLRVRTGGEEQHLRRRHPGRVDDHPAIREERFGGLGAGRAGRCGPQGQGVGHLDEDVQRMVERPSAAVLPEHHLFRPRRLWHRCRVQGVLRQAGRTAHRRRRRTVGRAHSTALRIGPGRQPRRFG